MAYLIALDDGHGMQTPGKRTPYIPELGRFIHENEFNRAVVKFLDAELKRCGFKTLLVAPTDDDTPLSTRINTANKAKADAYISIHFNALDGKFDGDGKDPEGMSLHVYKGHRNKPAGQLAAAIGKYLQQGTAQKYRGIVEQDLAVTRETHMIAVLSENGFMDNKREAILMASVDFQKEVAREHAQGICEYFKVKYVPEPKPVAPKPVAPKPVSTAKVPAGTYRVKLDGKQIAALSKMDGILSSVEEAVEKGIKQIELERVK